MANYSDLVSIKGTGTSFDKLVPLDSSKLAQLRSIYGALPADYTSFLSAVGFGELGQAAYMLYGGLLEPTEVYGDVPDRLSGVLLFGDDFQGFNTGFYKSDWKVIEIDPTNMRENVVASNFEEFIRRKITEV